MAATPSTNTTYFKSAIGIQKADGTYVDVIDANGQAVTSAGGSVQALTAAGAVNVTTPTTTIASSGAIALTLADGVQGQTKTIVMTADGGDATLTPANLANGTTITFNDVGDSVVLQFIGTEWHVVSNNGATIA